MNNLNNPLLAASTLDHEAIPFNEIKTSQFNPAFEAAFREARTNLTHIRECSASPTFENTVEALENCSDLLDRVTNIFSNLRHANTNEELQSLARTVMPQLAEFSNDIHLDPLLFTRIREVHESRLGLNLDPERARLLEKTFKTFTRNGALLSAEDKNRLREIDKQLALLGQQFSDNLLKATQAFTLVITDRSDLAGLPDAVIEAAASAAKERKHENAWVFTLDQPSYIPFIKYSERRELREKLWRAVSSRASSGDTDNRALLIDIAKLRHQRARLLGYATHANFVLEERMAATPETVRKFLERIKDASRAAAERDLAEVRSLAGIDDLRQWDFTHYSEKLRKKQYGFDEETLRPFFQLENVVAGVFEHARRLYGLSFRKREDLPVYHPDVQVFEVRDETSDNFVGLFYADFFPRPSKQNGAWMTVFRDQGVEDGKMVRPHVSIVCNLTKPTESRPSLLDIDEVRTVFHEFGHALHALLSECRYRSISGTNVYWDFVELPSQIMENWIREKDGLDVFAKHYQTGEPIPAELVDKIRETSRFQAGWMSLRQINLSSIDLAWHGVDPSSVTNVETYEAAATAETTLFKHVPGTMTSSSFSHIFSGGYASGYYSYKWAEVLDADAFELFQEQGLFNRDVARKFRDNILSRGGTEHPMVLYRRFRGREPDPDALLRRDGLI